MKRFLAVFLVVCTLWCGNTFAANEYEIIDMSEFSAVGEFSDGLCAVNTVDGESVLIDRNGDAVFKFKEFHNSFDRDEYYVKKHGKYKIVFENENVTLLSEDYSEITPENVWRWEICIIRSCRCGI